MHFFHDGRGVLTHSRIYPPDFSASECNTYIAVFCTQVWTWIFLLLFFFACFCFFTACVLLITKHFLIKTFIMLPDPNVLTRFIRTTANLLTTTAHLLGFTRRKTEKCRLKSTWCPGRLPELPVP
uniref:Uncharacterized protein n=1 Tax=Octopus bimaculoides TaxID=37653 RepID=A0A0L8GVH0_OCTBM